MLHQKSKYVPETNKTVNIPQQLDLPNTTEAVIKEVASSEPIETSEEKSVMPSTKLLDRALDDGSLLSKEELAQIVTLLKQNLKSLVLKQMLNLCYLDQLLHDLKFNLHQELKLAKSQI